MNEMPDIASILNMINGMKPPEEKVKDEAKEQNINFENANMPDMETMMKIMKVMNAMKFGENNPSTNLLNSLKPFLRDSKKEKVDQYIKFIKLSNVISEMNNEEK